MTGCPPPPPARLPNHCPRRRSLGLYLTGPGALDRFGGGDEAGLNDRPRVARNLVDYLTFCGASLVVLPDRLAGAAEVRRSLRGQADEDCTGPDRLDLALRLLRRQGYSSWLELNLEGEEALPGLPPPDSVEALRRGLVRVDRQGLADGPAYHPLHPEVRQAMKRRVETALKNPDGGGKSPGCWSSSARDRPCSVPPTPGWTTTHSPGSCRRPSGPRRRKESRAWAIPTRTASRARSKYLAGVGRMPWLTWRSRAIAALYSELAEAARSRVSRRDPAPGHAGPPFRGGGSRGPTRRPRGAGPEPGLEERGAGSPGLADGAERPDLAPRDRALQRSPRP